MTPVADDVATADVPSPRAAKKQKMRTTSQLSELCGLDDVLDAPHAPRESSAAAAASSYETPVRYPASAAPAGAPIRDVDTDDKPHQPSLHRASGGSSDVSTLVSPAGGAAPPGIVRHGSLPKNMHINIPRASVGSGASEDTNADAADADADAAASERVPPVTPATAFTAVPLHAAVAAGRVEDVRLWLEEHAPVDSRDVDDGVGESDRNGNGNDDVVASTPEWPPRPVRDILGPESVSREPPESSDGKLPARPVVRGIPGRRAPRASVRVRDSDRSSGGDLGARGGGPVDARNEHGNAALAVAAALSDAAVSATLTRLLLTHGASPLVLSSGWTPLHWAAQEGNVESLEAMAAWEGGRAVDARCEAFGRTPLTTAASAGRGACVEALIRAGADALALDVDGAGVLSHVATKVSKGVRSKVRAATRSALLAAAPKLKVLLLHHEDCGKHVSFKPHQESPERIAAVLASLAKGAASGALAEDEVSVSSEFEPATATHLARAHGEEYIGMITDLAERVANTPVAFTPYHQEFKGMPQAKQKKPEFSDTFFSPGTMTAALRAAGGVVHAVEKVLRGERRTAFVCVRPPGHHAGVNGATAGAPSAGFSILNNAMIGALHALEGNDGRLAKRVAVVDFDVHHGNGTEEIARAWHAAKRRKRARAASTSSNDADLLFASIHLADDGAGSGIEFYPGTGVADGLHDNVVNVCVPPMWSGNAGSGRAKLSPVGTRARVSVKRNRDDDLDCGGAALAAAKAAAEAAVAAAAPQGGRHEWMRRLKDRILPPLRAFKPDLLIISAGFDAANHDVGNVGVDRRGTRAAGINLTPDDYEEMTARLCGVAASSGARIVSVLEGGYGYLSGSEGGAEGLIREGLAACVVAHVRALAGLSEFHVV